MTNEEIMKLAHAASWEQGLQSDDCGDCSRFDVVKFARMVAGAERESIAKMCDEMQTYWADYASTALLNGDVELSIAASGEPRAAESLARMIRERK